MKVVAAAEALISNTQDLQRDLSAPFTNEVRRSELRIR